MKNKELTNYQRYLANVKNRGYDKLSSPKQKESIDDLIAEGDRLLEEESKAIVSTASVSSTPPKERATSTNPYRQARLKILSEMDPEKRSFIEQLEKAHNTDHYQYTDFVKQIQKLGDQLSQ